VIITFNLKVK